MSTIRVLLADDQPIFLDGIRRILQSESDIVVVGEAYNGRQAIRQAELLQPDVVLMDVQMHHVDGVEATRIIVQEMCLPCKVILFTTFNHDEYVLHGLQYGATGYLLKAGERDELLRAIRLAAAGKTWIDPSVAATVVAAMGRGTPALSTDNPLSDREQIMLQLVAAGRTNREIAEHMGHTEGTIKQYMRTVLEKLEAHDRTNAVIIARENNYI